MELKDYLHLYMGCELIRTTGGKEKLSAYSLQYIDEMNIWGEIKPILRPLSSMSEEDKTKLVIMFDDLNPEFIQSEQHFEIKHDLFKQHRFDCITKADEDADFRLGPTAYFQMTPFLLKQGYDLFGLIDAGLALDASKVSANA